MLKPPKWQEGVVATKVHIWMNETLAVVCTSASDHVQFLGRGRGALVLLELPHVVFSRQWGAKGYPEFLLWVVK